MRCRSWLRRSRPYGPSPSSLTVTTRKRTPRRPARARKRDRDAEDEPPPRRKKRKPAKSGSGGGVVLITIVGTLLVCAVAAGAFFLTRKGTPGAGGSGTDSPAGDPAQKPSGFDTPSGRESPLLPAEPPSPVPAGWQQYSNPEAGFKAYFPQTADREPHVREFDRAERHPDARATGGSCSLAAASAPTRA